MKKFLIIAFISLFNAPTYAQDLNAFFSTSDLFFSTHVKNGKVDYNAIAANPSELNAILDNASKINVKFTDAKTYQAFWINAYNLAVIKGLVTNYPTTSPLNDKGFFDKTTYKLAGQKVTLNSIENDLLRAKFNDARFHFVLVCGALGCPPLLSKAYLPETLDAQLTQQTQKAINGNFIKVSENKVEVSEIMKWYKADFTKNGQTEIDFLNSYLTHKLPKNIKMAYFPYDWSINTK